MVGKIIVGIVIVAGVAIAARVLSPVDYNINKVYMRRVLRASRQLRDDESLRSLKVSRIDVVASPEENLERVFHRLSLITNRGRQLYYVTQSFYPLAILFEEREKKKKSMATTQIEAQSNPYNLAGETSAGIEVPEQAKDDPIKAEAEEAEVKTKKIARLQAEIAQLRLLNKYTNLFPQLLNFDEKRLLTVVTDVGADRLDTLLAQATLEEKQRILHQVVGQLASSHAGSATFARGLLPGIQYNEPMLQKLLEMGISLWTAAGLLVTEADMKELIENLQPLIKTLQESERGLKLGEATPRNFYWNGESAAMLDWGRARWDLTCFDLAELLSDPAADLPRSVEQTLVHVYLEKRQWDPRRLQHIDYALIIYRIVLSGYMCQYISRRQEMSEEQQQQLGGVNWSPEYLFRVWDKLLEQTSQRPELAGLDSALRRIDMQHMIS